MRGLRRRLGDFTGGSWGPSFAEAGPVTARVPLSRRDLRREGRRTHCDVAGRQDRLSVAFDCAFAIGALLNIAFATAETVFGLTAHSVALLTDATHNFGDVLGLLLAWAAGWLGRREPTRRRTYGYGRCSILAATANAVVLLIGVGGIAAEALLRLSSGVPPGAVDGGCVIIVAAAGIIVNGATALLFARIRVSDLNVRGTCLHMTADTAISAAVVASGFAITLTGQAWLDPAISLLTAALILASTWGLLRDSINLALDTVPKTVDQHAVLAYLAALPGVAEIHDLHIWALSTTETALTAHLVRPHSGTDDALLRLAGDELRRRFGIGHATFQVEEGGGINSCRSICDARHRPDPPPRISRRCGRTPPPR